MSANPFKIIRSTDLPPAHLRGEVLGSVATGCYPHADFGPHSRDQGVRRVGYRRSVDPDDGDRGLGPKSLCH